MSEPRLTRDKVLHVAKLAALELEAAEIDPMVGQLADIVAYVESLAALDVTDVPPTFQPVDLAPPMRPDTLLESLPRERALAAAPASDSGGFAVPKVLDSDG